MSTIQLAIMLKIYPHGKPKSAALYYQNYRPTTPILYGGKSYAFAPLQIENYPNNDLQLTAEDTQILMGRSSALDEILWINNDLKRAVCDIIHIQPGTSVPPIGLRRQVSHTTREGATIAFTLRSATNALQGAIATKYFDSSDFPENPYYKVR